MLYVLVCLAFAQDLDAPNPSAVAPNSEILSKTEAAQHITASLVLKVEKREIIAAQIIKKLEEIGGYYSLRTDQRLQLRVPTEKMETFTEFCSQLGVAAGRTFKSQSLSQELSELHGKLKSREELLDKYFQILESSKADSVTVVEKEVIRLISAIENLKAQKDNASLRAQFSHLDIAFQFRDRRQPVADGSSEFDWLNTLNLSELLEQFQDDVVPGHVRTLKAPIPAGFAQYKVKRETRAASFDQVLYRARKYRSDQRADDAFWAEAVQHRMKQAGYFGYQNADLQSTVLDNGVQLIQTLAPYGQEDYSYWIAFRSEKNAITIIEAAGEVSRFEGHKDSILQAIKSLPSR